MDDSEFTRINDDIVSFYCEPMSDHFFANYKHRLSSFDHWFLTDYKIKTICQAGFFASSESNHISDCIVCFNCGLTLHQIKTDDEHIYLEHMMYSNNKCIFIRKVLSHALNIGVKVQIPCAPNAAEDLICRICFDSQRTTVTFPCRHFMMCARCAEEFKNKPCPLCKTFVVKLEHVFVP